MKRFKHLEKFWHGDRHPYDALVQLEGKPAGLGLLMQKYPETLTTYNLVFLKHPDMCGSVELMQACVMAFPKLNTLANEPYQGGTLGEYSCLISQGEFKRLMSCNAKLR